jgi:micrococcal nuclease
MWEYRAHVVRVVDGDTIDVVTDLGFGLDGLAMRLRLLGVDAPEVTGPTADAGNAATAFTRSWLYQNKDDNDWILVTTIKSRQDRDKADSFGRYLAMVWDMGRTANLNEALLTNGFGVPYVR